MLKLTTDKHEASRGLSATAELLVIILSLLETEIICPQTHIEFPTLLIVCCCTTLKNAKCNRVHFSKLFNKYATHAVISLLLQSTKFW